MKLTTKKLKELIKEEIEKLNENPFGGPTRAKSGNTRAPEDPNDPLSGPTRAKQAGDDAGEGLEGATRVQQSADQSGKIEDRVEKLEQVVNQLIAAIKKNN